MKPLRIALSKGRIFNETIPLLAKAGITPVGDPDSSRSLIIKSNQPGVELLIVRSSDVATYVQYGGADVGIVGKDSLLEHGGEGLLEPLDLNIARCRLMVCGHPGTQLDEPQHRFRVATKYPAIARAHFASKARQVEVIKLYGSMELAPLAGLSDLIVDVVDSGATLEANGLVPLELIAEISSRLIVNRASLKTRQQPIANLIDKLGPKD